MGKRVVEVGSGYTKTKRSVYDGDDTSPALAEWARKQNKRWEEGGKTHVGFNAFEALKWAQKTLNGVDRCKIKIDSQSPEDLAYSLMRRYEDAQHARRCNNIDLFGAKLFSMGHLWSTICWKYRLESEQRHRAKKSHQKNAARNVAILCAYDALPSTAHGRIKAVARQMKISVGVVRGVVNRRSKPKSAHTARSV